MSRLLIRIMAFLLVPCLIADPVTVSAISSLPASHLMSGAVGENTIFKQEAIPAAVAFTLQALSDIGWKDRRTLSSRSAVAVPGNRRFQRGFLSLDWKSARVAEIAVRVVGILATTLGIAVILAQWNSSYVPYSDPSASSIVQIFQKALSYSLDYWHHISIAEAPLYGLVLWGLKGFLLDPYLENLNQPKRSHFKYRSTVSLAENVFFLGLGTTILALYRLSPPSDLIDLPWKLILVALPVILIGIAFVAEMIMRPRFPIGKKGQMLASTFLSEHDHDRETLTQWLSEADSFKDIEQKLRSAGWLTAFPERLDTQVSRKDFADFALVLLDRLCPEPSLEFNESDGHFIRLPSRGRLQTMIHGIVHGAMTGIGQGWVTRLNERLQSHPDPLLVETSDLQSRYALSRIFDMHTGVRFNRFEHIPRWLEYWFDFAKLIENIFLIPIVLIVVPIEFILAKLTATSVRSRVNAGINAWMSQRDLDQRVHALTLSYRTYVFARPLRPSYSYVMNPYRSAVQTHYAQVFQQLYPYVEDHPDESAQVVAQHNFALAVSYFPEANAMALLEDIARELISIREARQGKGMASTDPYILRLFVGGAHARQDYYYLTHPDVHHRMLLSMRHGYELLPVSQGLDDGPTSLPASSILPFLSIFLSSLWRSAISYFTRLKQWLPIRIITLAMLAGLFAYLAFGGELVFGSLKDAFDPSSGGYGVVVIGAIGVIAAVTLAILWNDYFLALRKSQLGTNKLGKPHARPIQYGRISHDMTISFVDAPIFAIVGIGLLILSDGSLFQKFQGIVVLSYALNVMYFWTMRLLYYRRLSPAFRSILLTIFSGWFVSNLLLGGNYLRYAVRYAGSLFFSSDSLPFQGNSIGSVESFFNNFVFFWTTSWVAFEFFNFYIYKIIYHEGLWGALNGKNDLKAPIGGTLGKELMTLMKREFRVHWRQPDSPLQNKELPAAA